MAGFSDCSMKALSKVNDACLYNRPKEVSLGVFDGTLEAPLTAPRRRLPTGTIESDLCSLFQTKNSNKRKHRFSKQFKTA